MATLLAPIIECNIQIQLRLATHDDLPKLEWHGEYTHFRNVYRRTLHEQQSGKRLMILADLNNYPVGQIFVLLSNFNLPQPQPKHPSTDLYGYIYSLRVMEHLRGLGVGTQLIYCAESMLRQRGYDWSIISVGKNNPRARQLYERLGYQIYAEDAGRWQYINHHNETVHVHEPCWMLEKLLKTV